MADVTQILAKIEAGNSGATEDLLPLVYDELRRLALQRMAREKPGQTLQATGLVHEAWIKLVDGNDGRHWDSRAHFFAAAAESMRRILVDNAIRKQAQKRGGDRRKLDFADIEPAVPPPREDILALNAALNRLAELQPRTVELVKLRYFAGLTNKQAAELLGISSRKADSLWAYARVWLHDFITAEEASD